MYTDINNIDTVTCKFLLKKKTEYPVFFNLKTVLELVHDERYIYLLNKKTLLKYNESGHGSSKPHPTDNEPFNDSSFSSFPSAAQPAHKNNIYPKNV